MTYRSFSLFRLFFCQKMYFRLSSLQNMHNIMANSLLPDSPQSLIDVYYHISHYHTKFGKDLINIVVSTRQIMYKTRNKRKFAVSNLASENRLKCARYHRRYTKFAKPEVSHRACAVTIFTALHELQMRSMR